MQDIINPTATFDTPVYELGTRAFDDQGREFVFVHYSDTRTLGRGRMAVYGIDYVAKRMSHSNASVGHRLGGSLIQSNGLFHGGGEVPNAYLWICIYGVIDLTGRNSPNAHTNLYTVDDWGRLDDSSSGQTRVHHVFFKQQPQNNTDPAQAVLYYPFH